MRELNEQWIEEIDGEPHMVKAVAGNDCAGCVFGSRRGDYQYDSEHYCPIYGACPTMYDGIVKDLGILKDGVLPCPFCGEYPVIEPFCGDSTDILCIKDDCHTVFTLEDTAKQAIDAWNRRA